MIKLLIMDVDGTLTDGGIYYDDAGHEMKKFYVKDGTGIRIALENGIECMILTGRESACVKRRGEELGISYICQGITDKQAFLQNFMKEKGLSGEDIAYIGDDVNDLECMQLVKFRGCPADAAKEVKNTVEYICQKAGGCGAVREFIEWIMEANSGVRI